MHSKISIKFLPCLCRHGRQVALALVVLLGASPGVSLAAFNDAHLDTSTVITVGGVDLLVAGVGADLESIQVDSSTMTLTLIVGSSIRVTSADRRVISATNLGVARVTGSCTSSQSEYFYEVPTGDATATPILTVESSTCSTGGGGGGGSSGGGGGGGSSGYVYVPPSTTPAPTVTPTTTVTPSATVTAPSAVRAITATVDRLLTKGMTNPGVRTLQQILNSDPDTRIAVTGPGSSGNESDFFGPATLKAVQKFQVKYGIAKPGESGYGNVGPLTRTVLNSIAGKGATSVGVPATPATPASPASSGNRTSVSGSVTRALAKGATNAQVRTLQQILNSDPDTRISVDGAGSPGSETDFFGSATLKAIQKFQVKYGIAKPGDSGYGNVGPLTRTVLNSLIK